MNREKFAQGLAARGAELDAASEIAELRNRLVEAQSVLEQLQTVVEYIATRGRIGGHGDSYIELCRDALEKPGGPLLMSRNELKREVARLLFERGVRARSHQNQVESMARANVERRLANEAIKKELDTYRARPLRLKGPITVVIELTEGACDSCGALPTWSMTVDECGIVTGYDKARTEHSDTCQLEEEE